MKANCSACSNIQCSDNENLSGSTKLAPGSLKGVPPNTPPTNENNTPDDNTATGEPAKVFTDDGKYILENHQVTAAGMRKLSRNWENCLSRISRASDGQLMLRRSSESSGINTGSSSDSQISGKRPLIKSGSSQEGKSSNNSGSSPSDSLEQRAPWKPC